MKTQPVDVIKISRDHYTLATFDFEEGKKIYLDAVAHFDNADDAMKAWWNYARKSGFR
jgi:hypothetical protein